MNDHNTLNIVPEIFGKLISENDDKQFKFVVVFIVMAAVLAYLHASIQSNIISGTSIIIILISVFATYYYVNKKYKKKLRSLYDRTLLDKICKSRNSHKICPVYLNSRINYNKILNMLVKQI